MNRIVVDKLIKAFPFYADLKLLELPDGWLKIVNELFCDFRDLQKMMPGHMPRDPDIEMVSVNWRRLQWPSHVLYVKPVVHHRHWTPEMSARLIQVVSRFNEFSQHTCEVCGDQSVTVLKYQDGRRQESLCQVHLEERQWS